jgi:uncharacterized membrane protein YfcA
MPEPHIVIIACAVLAMAALYSTVGHGGGSGYLAVMAIASISPEQMRPTALLLNIIVASIATWKFGATGTFRRDLFIPIVCASVPAAFVGGMIDMSSSIYKPIVGIILVYAAIRLFIPVRETEGTKKPQLLIMLVVGVLIGVLSGVIGVGGGIFLSPLILLFRWSSAKQTAAISAPFILVNSIAGLGGIVVHQSELPVDMGFVAPLAIAVVIGGMIGSSFGSRRLGHQNLRRVLGVVLFVASIKMFLTMGTSDNVSQPNNSTQPSDTILSVDVKSVS